MSGVTWLPAQAAASDHGSAPRRMVFHRQSSTLALGVMRLMGMFPYRWGDDSSLLLTALGSAERRIPRSWPWVAWSLVVGTFTMVVYGIEIYLGFRGSTVSTIPTLQVTRSLYDIFKGVMGLVMCLYALFYSPRLAQAISHADKVCRDFNLRGASAREVSIMILIIILAVLIIVVCSAEVATTWEFTMISCASVLTHLFKNVLLAMIPILYNNCINVITLAYSSATEKIMSKESSTLNDERIIIQSIALPKPEAQRELPLTEEDFYSIGRRLLQLQSFHRRLNKYFAPAVVMTMVMSMFTSILSLFYMSLFPFVGWKEQTLTCIYLFLSMQLLFTLTNTSVALNTKVR